MRAALVLLVVGFLLSVAVGDLASRHVGPLLPLWPDAVGQEGGLLNDAGTGGDAGNSRATASLLMSFGHYAAGFIGMDTDWYRHAPSLLVDPGCVKLEATGDRLNDFLLEAGIGGSRATLVSTIASTTLALAVPDMGDTYVAFNTQTPHEVAQSTYEFLDSFTAPTLSGGDGGTGGDAGSTSGTAISIVDACVTGNVGGSGDHFDLYALRVLPGQRLVFTLAADPTTDLRFALLGPNENTIRIARAGETMTYQATGESKLYVAVSDVMGPSSGEASWSLLDDSSFDGEDDLAVPYVIGVCKPFCLMG